MIISQEQVSYQEAVVTPPTSPDPAWDEDYDKTCRENDRQRRKFLIPAIVLAGAALILIIASLDTAGLIVSGFALLLFLFSLIRGCLGE